MVTWIYHNKLLFHQIQLSASDEKLGTQRLLIEERRDRIEFLKKKRKDVGSELVVFSAESETRS